MAETATRPRLLVVDDNEIVRVTVSDVLALIGYDADVAADGREALGLLVPGRYVCILTDLDMPGMDGFAVAEEVRRADPAAGIVLLTGSEVDTEPEGIAADVTIVTKPLDSRSLRAAIARAIAARTNGRA